TRFSRDWSSDVCSSDLQRESKPKFMLSGAYHQNNLATRTQGTLGEEMFAPRTFRSFFADAVFKYNGWAAMAAFMSRSTNQDPVKLGRASCRESGCRAGG